MAARRLGNDISSTPRPVKFVATGYLLNTSEMKLRDQSKWNRCADSNALQAPSSKDQFEATCEPHQKVSARHVVKQDITTNAITIQSASRKRGIVWGISRTYKARMENLGK